jgi:septal ring factor EnvC (AmiA/AmiB activator)
MIDPFSAISIASSGITVTTSPDYLLDGLTASYVLLTLALAIIAFRSLRQTQASLDLTRQQIELNKQQSQEASAASERYSQATIDAVNKQIAASEAQSNAAIEAINRQIAASQQQAQEALYNQQKPVLVPVGDLGNIIGTSDGKLHVKWGYQN